MQKVEARLLSLSAVAGLSLIASACLDDATSITRPIATDAFLATAGTSGATQNGQSIMVTPLFAGSYTVTGEETWKMDDDAARLLYATVVTGPTISCSGGPPGSCDAANQPATPSAPPVDPNQPTNPYFAASSDKNRCVFWNGGTPDTPAPYTLDVTVNGVNGKGNWKFTWTYTLTAPADVAPKTAWYLQSSTGSGDAQVDLDGFVAGQSVLKKIKAAKNDWTFKASHTINDGLGGHRVVSLAYDVDGTGAVLFDPLTQLQFEAGVDYDYAQNSGNNGFTNLLVDGGTVNNIQNGLLAAYSGEKDDFSGNNATLGERVNFFGPSVLLGGGNHTVRITGIVKGNSGLGDLTVDVTSQLIIHAQGCAVVP
jgi:hypothetical protein